MTTNKQIAIIGHNHYGRIPIAELLEFKTNHNNEQLTNCKRCGSIEHIMRNGYCVDCEEELNQTIK